MANYRFLNLNTYKGKYLEKIVKFVNQEKFDLVHLQEVSGGSISQHSDHDDFHFLTKSLDLKGKLASAMGLKGESQAYFGNATFFNPNKLKLISSQILRLTSYAEIAEYDSRRIEDDPRCVLILTFKANGHHFLSLNTHLAWGPRPDDKPYKIKQAQILVDYLKKLNKPFILSGDFNVSADTQIIEALNQVARNISLEQGIGNTLNPNLHRVKKLFPPGLLVDFVYISPEIKIKQFFVPQFDLSDHYPSVAKFSLAAK